MVINSLWNSGWFKFFLSCAIIWAMVAKISDGTMNLLWLLGGTLGLTLLLKEQAVVFKARWDETLKDEDDEGPR